VVEREIPVHIIGVSLYGEYLRSCVVTLVRANCTDHLREDGNGIDRGVCAEEAYGGYGPLGIRSTNPLGLAVPMVPQEMKTNNVHITYGMSARFHGIP
jgi:hypothetical protein